MKTKEIRFANEYLGKAMDNGTYFKGNKEGVKQYFGIPLPEKRYLGNFK